MKKLDEFKANVAEWIKYDFNNLKLPMTWLVTITIWALYFIKKDTTAFKLASSLFRSGWAGSYNTGLRIARLYMKSEKRFARLIEDFLKNISETPHTKKCFENPSSMLGHIITVLKQSSENEKGVIILNYSYYFPLFLKFFDLEKLTSEYNIILEPSWAGYCELEILSYNLLSEPIYIMAFEERDKKFINDLDANFITLPVGPNWFVNHNNFQPLNSDNIRDIDIIMVASWAKFKRHNHFFTALRELKFNYKSDLKVVLVGYPNDLNKDDILNMARNKKVEDIIKIYEWISPEEVATLYRRSKVNVIWSRFEGPNRAVIEGMLCDTPVVMREGFNYGEHYDFITDKTGHFATEHNLPEMLIHMIENQNKYQPRDHALKTRSSITATRIIDDIISKYELKAGRSWTTNLVVKVNDLNGMDYLEKSDSLKMKNEYSKLEKFLL